MNLSLKLVKEKIKSIDLHLELLLDEVTLLRLALKADDMNESAGLLLNVSDNLEECREFVKTIV